MIELLMYLVVGPLLTAAAALDLSDVLGTSPKLWMNVQATYDLEKAAKARRAD